MKDNLADPSVFVDAVVSSRRDLTTCLAQLFDYCREHCPSSIWEELRHLDFEEDVVRLTNWLRAVLTSEPPGAEIEALWFGLRSTPQERDLLYLAGSDYFDLEDHGWVRFPIYWPASRRADSRVLQRIHQSLRKAGGQVFSLGWYVLCLGYACLAVAEACRTIEPDILLGTRDKRYIAVGFDGGDFVALGWVDKSGWHVLEAVEQPAKEPGGEVRPAGPSLLHRAAGSLARAILALLRLLWRLLVEMVLPLLGRLIMAGARVLGRLVRRLAHALAGYILGPDIESEKPLGRSPLAPAGSVPAPTGEAVAATASEEAAAADSASVAAAVTKTRAPATTAGREPHLGAAGQEEKGAASTVAATAPGAVAEVLALPGAAIAPPPEAGPMPDSQARSIAAAMDAYAQEAVAMARKEFGVELDFGEASLEQVEWMLSRIAGWRSSSLSRQLMRRLLGKAVIDRAENLVARLQGREPPQVCIQSMSRIWGAYVGEVMRRRWRGTWAEEEPHPADTMIALRVQRYALFPIGRVQARLEGGPEHSIWFYYRALKQRFEGV
ncbi:MAG: hypothetical protein K6V36_07515 [Anaerolineae bacterium]|nr:hypothetical protein [Anaerolineae bacterium]